MRRFDGDTLLVATHNKGKLEEIAELLKPYGVSVIGAADRGLAEPDETEDTFIGNARIKAKAAVEATGLPALADDSGLTIDGLGGAPGVYTADWAGTENGRDFPMAMTRTWNELEAANAPEPRSAQFRCTLRLLWPVGHEESFEGIVPGRISWPMRGDEGHGFDPIFVPDGHDITFGEMDRWENNKMSHRGRAMEQMIAGCFA